MNKSLNIAATEALGTYGETSDGRTTITFTRYLNHPIDRVWKAIVNEQDRQKWFPELTLDAQVGGSAVVDFSGGDCPAPEENPSDINVCKVTRIDPPHLLEYKGPTEEHLFQLETKDSGCKLIFVATVPGVDRFDDPNQQIISRYSVSCGWHYKLDMMQWDLDGLSFEDEGYAGPIKTELYFRYLKADKGGKTS